MFVVNLPEFQSFFFQLENFAFSVVTSYSAFIVKITLRVTGCKIEEG